MTLTKVTFADLVLSELNTRKVEPSGIEAMAKDIAAHGIITSLGTYVEEGRHHVFAGGRRLRAMALLHEQESIGSEYEVPVQIFSKEQAIELSLSENTARENMHHADQIRVYGQLHKQQGLSAAEIAGRFGYLLSHVAKLLRLGSLPAELIDAMGRDELSLEAAQQLCLTTDPTKQLEAYEQCGDNAYAIKRFFTEEKMTTQNKFFLFVGQEAYVEAGGTITPDLFSQGDEGYADDPELVRKMAIEALAEKGEELKEEGWFKVSVSLDMPEKYWSVNPLYPEERDFTEDEAKAIAAIDEQLAKSEEDQNEDEYDALINQRSQLLKNALFYSEDQKACGGALVHINHNGELDIKLYEAVASKGGKGGNGEEGAGVKPLYSAKLVTDLQTLRSMALQQAVAADSTLALDILLDTLAGPMLHNSYSSDTPSAIEANATNLNAPDELHDERLGNTYESVAENFAFLPATDRFAAIREMDSDAKMQLLAGLVASTLSHSEWNSERFDEYSQAANVDMSELWDANVSFCDRLTKANALTIMEEECGAEAALNCKKLKKAEVAEQLAERLPQGWLPNPMRGVSPPAQDEQSGDSAKVA